MGRYVEGEAREQSLLFPERLEDWVAEDSMVRVIDVFVEELDLVKLGFERAEPSSIGRPGYNPATLLKIYIYGYAMTHVLAEKSEIAGRCQCWQ